MTHNGARPRRARRGRAGNQGQRPDGRYLVAARVESLCENCGFVVGIGDLAVRDDFGQWVHDRCCP
ncbi:MAG TPA: hypothetical protein VGL02_26680 [Streptomyces sp.]